VLLTLRVMHSNTSLQLCPDGRLTKRHIENFPLLSGHNATGVVIIIYFVSAGTVVFVYSAASTGTKELPVELTEGSKKSSDSGWGCTASSMLVMDTVIV
jgi:hypothetical protein